MTSLRLLSENRKRAYDTSSISLSLSLPLTTLTSCPGRECSPWLRECRTPRTWECAEGLEGCRWPKDFSSTPRRTSLQWTFWWGSSPKRWPRVSTWRSWKVHHRLVFLIRYFQKILLIYTHLYILACPGISPARSSTAFFNRFISIIRSRTRAWSLVWVPYK